MSAGLDDGAAVRRWTVQLPKDVPASRTARSVLEDWLQGLEQHTVDAARNIVTELVSDAVRFGRPPIRLTVEQQPTGLRIEVSDDGAATASGRAAGRHGGWGLEIVRQLADDHGALPGGDGVWCELRTG